MIWLLPQPLYPPSPISKWSLFLSLPVCRAIGLTNGTGEAGVGEEPTETYDGEKAWSPINHSILSVIKEQAVRNGVNVPFYLIATLNIVREGWGRGGGLQLDFNKVLCMQGCWK